jgi:hypothetical protein
MRMRAVAANTVETMAVKQKRAMMAMVMGATYAPALLGHFAIRFIGCIGRLPITERRIS